MPYLSDRTLAYSRQRGCARRRSLATLGLLVLLAGAANRTRAHPMAPDLTVAQLKIHYHLLDMTLRGPANELLGPAQVKEKEIAGEETKTPVLSQLAHWLPQQFLLEKDGKPLTPEVVSIEQQNYSSGPQYTMVVHYVTDKPAEHLRITSKFVHTIVSANGVQVEMTGDKEPVREFDTRANLSNIWNNVIDFVGMGMEHLFTGPDHILFICTLIFALMDFKSVVKMLTGFTVGHSITLILSTFNIIHIPARIADMGIALTIMYVGLENIFRKEMPKNRFWIVTLFGLVHGMGFSSSLKEVGLPEQGLVLCLLGFNLGIELAQIIIVACVYPILSRLRWYKEAQNEKHGTRNFKMLMNFGSAITACMGCYWFVERIMTR